MTEREPYHEPLQTILLCVEHNSVLVKDAYGQLYCYEGGEPIAYPEQVYEGIGRIINFPDNYE